jgi:hypothetical protein
MAALQAVCLSACSSGPRASFSPTVAYTAKSGPPPPVVLQANQLPRTRLRSVGVIAVKAESQQRAIPVARDKGAELGCQYLIEHALFVREGSHVEVGFGARILLAHAGLHTPDSHTRARVQYKFDCAFAVPDIKSA